MAAHLLAGLNIFRVGVDRGLFNDDSRTESGLNLGAGLVFDLGGPAQVILDAKYAVSDADQLVLGLGVLFRL